MYNKIGILSPLSSIALSSRDVIPFEFFLWKIASRCNLNCSYCYVYNSVDKSWKEQPRLMSEKVAYQSARRILEHCKKHDRKNAVIIFHGGEPLLGGIEHLRILTSIINQVFTDSGIDVRITIQSNGLLFTPEIGELLADRGVSLGISIDGPPKVNDLYRVDHQGRPSSSKLEEQLQIISKRYRKIFSGFLCVININTDPLEIIKYLLSYDPPSIDFLFPDNNFDRRPLGKESDLDATPYADWLLKIFDYWFYQNDSTKVRLFNSIIRQLFGFPSLMEALGLEPVSLVCVETNGDLEALDVLKSTFPGATKLGYNVFDHDLDIVARHAAICSRQMGIDGLCQKCKECPVVGVCGGGYYPHRYSTDQGFDNPSVYSSDLEKLIRHIHASIDNEISQTKSRP